MLYAAKRLNSLNEFCVVCDERHLFENSSMLKVCHLVYGIFIEISINAFGFLRFNDVITSDNASIRFK